MENGLVTGTELGEVPTISIFALVLEAGLVVQLVMIVLVLASLWCWAVIFDKARRLYAVNKKTTAFEHSFWSGAPLDQIYRHLGGDADHPVAIMFQAAMEEWREAPPNIPIEAKPGLLQRIERVLQLSMDRELAILEENLSSLATIGSVAPFIGLFGTVWGIMNSFQSIALAENTSLAVVAPGIAEALFATALGLLAAIPAVVAYNRFSNSIDRLSDRLASFSDEFNVVVSRELDNAKVAS